MCANILCLSVTCVVKSTNHVDVFSISSLYYICSLDSVHKSVVLMESTENPKKRLTVSTYRKRRAIYRFIFKYIFIDEKIRSASQRFFLSLGL